MTLRNLLRELWGGYTRAVSEWVHPGAGFYGCSLRELVIAMSKEQERLLRIAVIGVGSFGRNHARVYRELANEQQAGAVGKLELAAVVDRDRARAEAVAAEFGARAYT